MTPRILCGLLAAAACALSAGSGHADLGATPPALPAQPSAPISAVLERGCPQSSERAGTWSPVTGQTTSGQDAAPDYQVTVDPWAPCIMYRATSAQALDRSSDGGHTWTSVFRDAARGSYSAATTDLKDTPPFQASAVVVPRRGAVVLGERGNGDAVVASTDAGEHWALADNGLAGQPVEGIVTAPSDPGVAYALRSNQANATSGLPYQSSTQTTMPLSAGAFTLYVTRDGGGSWTPTATLTVGSDPQDGTAAAPDAVTAATGQMPLLAVDPTDAGHLWAVLPAQGILAGAAVVFESTDHGAHWHRTGTIGPAAVLVTPGLLRIDELVAVHSARHRLRLFVVGALPSGTTVEYSDDGGATWFAVAVPGTDSSPAIAVDPANQDHVLYAGTGMRSFNGTSYPAVDVYYSTDGMDTVRRLPGPRASAGTTTRTPITSTSGMPSSSAILQADRNGDFYLGVAFQCVGFTLPPDCPAQGMQGQAYYRLAPPPPVSSPASFAPPPGSVIPGAPGPPSPPSYAPIPLVELASCAMPVVGSGSGSLAYDMQDLLYTQAGDTGPQPWTAVIHRMSTLGACADTGAMVVHFSPDDLRTVALHNGYASADRPSIDTLAYDARRNAVWFTLSTGGGFLFMAPLGVDAGSGRIDVSATLRFHAGQGCIAFLTYDVSDDSLWTCGSNTPHVRAADGTPIVDDCGVTDSVPGSSRGIATWVVSAPDHLLIQAEDDQTLYDYNHVTCTLERTYLHRPYDEPAGEDEQEACDPLTFGADSPLPIHTTALWIRDATASTVTAYALPDGSCPLPTVTRYVGQTRADAGGQVTLCATLAVQGRNRVLANLPLQFLLDGAPVDSTRVTDGNGVACTNPAAAPSPGTHDIRVDFTGDVSFLPSHDLAALLVTAPGVFTPPRPLTPPVAPPNPPPAPQSAPIPQPAPLSQVQVQAQAQVQTQAQAQSQAQPAGQSVVVTQRQQQAELQLAFAEQRTAVQQAPAPQASSYNMTRLGSADADTAPDPGGVLLGIAGLIGSLGLGIAWALRAPAYATAQRRRQQRIRRLIE